MDEYLTKDDDFIGKPNDIWNKVSCITLKKNLIANPSTIKNIENQTK